MHCNLQYVGLVSLLRWDAKLNTDVVGFGDVQRLDGSTEGLIPHAEVQCPLDRIDIVVDTGNVVAFVGGDDMDGQLKLDTLFGGRNDHGARSEQ